MASFYPIGDWWEQGANSYDPRRELPALGFFELAKGGHPE